MKGIAIALGVVATLAGLFGLGWHFGVRSTQGEHDRLDARIAQLEHERDEAVRRAASPLSSALASVFAHRHAAQAAPPSPAAATGPTANGAEDRADEASGPADFSLILGKAADKQRVERERIQHDLDMTSDQEAAAQKILDEMNQKIGDDFAKLLDAAKLEPKNSRNFLGPAISLLTAIKDGDQAYRGVFTDDQQRRLDEDGFDMVAQIDPNDFLSKLPPSALLTLSQAAAGSH